MEDNTTYKGEFRFSDSAMLAKLIGNQDLKDDIRKNIEALGEGFPDLAHFDEKLAVESSPKKNLVFHMPFRPGGDTLVAEVTDKRLMKQANRSSNVTMFDIVNDRKSGLPTHSEVSLHNKIERNRAKNRSNATDKKAKLEAQGSMFKEDEYIPQISLAEQLLFKKTEPSFIQPKKRLAPARWEDGETKQFYRILQLIGTDFTVMEQFFPKRNRKQLLRKFHKEKKNNPKEVERALQNNQKINGTGNKDKFKWLMDNSIDLKFSETNSSSFDSTDMVDPHNQDDKQPHKEHS